jgi:signal transduction histidine kinase
MSHELRTPLNAIGGYADLLQLEVAGPVLPQQREYLVRVQRAQQHLLGLINNILNFAKLEAGGVQFTVTAVPLQPIIAEAQSLVAPQLAARDIRFQVQPGPDAAVAADTEKVRQILLNLLSNAVKFTEPGGRVDVDWRVNGRTALIRVRDTGIGIPSDRLDHIFDPFVQVDADLARTRQGTGLGLAIARELAQRMGGDITVESAVGKGTTFTVQLPLHVADHRV